MTKRELIQEYVAGRIDRRDFLVRMTGLGVSSAAALAYAQSLTSSASAAGLRKSPNGFVLHADSGEYGPGGVFTTVAELLEFLADVFQDLSNFLGALLADLLGARPAGGLRLLAPIAIGDALPNGNTVTQDDLDNLKTLYNQLSQHTAAITAAFADFGATPPKAVSAAASASGGDLTTLADKLNTLVSIQAAVLPTITGSGAKTDALRVMLTGAALVEAEQAAFVNLLVGNSPFPSAFAKAATGDDVNSLKSALGK